MDKEIGDPSQPVERIGQALSIVEEQSHLQNLSDAADSSEQAIELIEGPSKDVPLEVKCEEEAKQELSFAVNG